MGGIILVFSLIIWALSYFPHSSVADATQTKQAAVEQSASVDEPEDSYLQSLGQFIAPVMSPMHFDWKMSVGILSGIGAKELVVSTLAVMYANEDVDTDSAASDTHLSQALRSNMTTASALAYLVFILFYFPCIATITAIKNESGGVEVGTLYCRIYYSICLCGFFAYLLDSSSFWFLK